LTTSGLVEESSSEISIKRKYKHLFPPLGDLLKLSYSSGGVFSERKEDHCRGQLVNVAVHVQLPKKYSLRVDVAAPSRYYKIQLGDTRIKN
jgi:hypothetical protein